MIDFSRLHPDLRRSRDPTGNLVITFDRPDDALTYMFPRSATQACLFAVHLIAALGELRPGDRLTVDRVDGMLLTIVDPLHLRVY